MPTQADTQSVPHGLKARLADMGAPLLWGVVWGGIQAASPLGFWWLDPATVYALGLALIASVYIGFAVADGRWKVIAVETTVTAAFVVVAAVGVTRISVVPRRGIGRARYQGRLAIPHTVRDEHAMVASLLRRCGLGGRARPGHCDPGRSRLPLTGARAAPGAPNRTWAAIDEPRGFLPCQDGSGVVVLEPLSGRPTCRNRTRIAPGERCRGVQQGWCQCRQPRDVCDLAA
jgi:hypothetical protein